MQGIGQSVRGQAAHSVTDMQADLDRETQNHDAARGDAQIRGGVEPAAAVSEAAGNPWPGS
jgi:hypothetical protein